MVSIAMATYNGQKFIKEQIDSILAQTITDFELIISDDNSTDTTVSIIKEYKDKRIKLFENHENIGFVKNFERALQYCKGDYIAFSDQDDIWEPFHLEVLLNNLNKKDLVCSNAELIDEYGKKANVSMSDVLHLKKLPKDENLIYSLLNKNFVQGSTILFKKDLLVKAFPIPEGVKFHDHWLALFAANHGGINYTKQSTLLYRQHSAAITRDKAYTLKQKIHYYKEHKQKIKETYNYYYHQSVLFLEKEKENFSQKDIEQLKKEQLFLLYRGEKRLKNLIPAIIYYYMNYNKLYYDNDFIYFFFRFISIFF